MERELFRAVKAAIRSLGRRRQDGRQRHTDGTILEVYFWSVVHDRPVVWATDPRNWPPGLRRGALPSQSCMSRRLRRPRVRRLIERVESLVSKPLTRSTLTYIIDAKPLPIGAHSHDRQSGFGRAAGIRARGYKLHMLVALSGAVIAWRVAPMNTDEREMARRLLIQARVSGYVLGDANFDSSPLFDEAAASGAQLVAPRRMGSNRGLGHHRHSPWRLRCRDLLENTVSDFGRDLFEQRRAIERVFGHLASTSGLLTHLPPWVRTHRRVWMWVQAKLILAAARAHIVARNRKRVA